MEAARFPSGALLTESQVMLLPVHKKHAVATR